MTKIRTTDKATIERAARWAIRHGADGIETSRRILCDWLDVNDAQDLSALAFSRFVAAVDQEIADLRRLGALPARARG